MDYSLAAMILAAASIEYPGYIPTAWQTFLLTVLLLSLHAGISSMPTRWIARVNSYGSTFNMLALITVLIAIPAGVTSNPNNNNKTGFTPSSEVWRTITNGTDFPDGIAVLMTFVGVIWTMAGYDSPFHLSEECSNANIAAPRAITITSAAGGVLGWLLQLVVAYTVQDIEAVMDSPLGQPWASYLLQVLPQRTAIALLALTIVCGFSMGQGCMVAASRVTYAYARDDCFPLSRVWKRVNHRTHTPVNAVLLNAALGICMSLLMLAGPVAIGALFSIGAIAQFVAFAIPIAIRVVCHGRFRRGPWHLGRWGRVVGGVGVVFVVFMVPVLCLPQTTGRRLSAKLMNWTCLVYGAPMLGVVVWWVVDARWWFKGPRVNVEHVVVVVDEEDGDGDVDGRGSQDSTRSLTERFK